MESSANIFFLCYPHILFAPSTCFAQLLPKQKSQHNIADDIERAILELEEKKTQLSLRKLLLWSTFKLNSQPEMIAKLGFGIEPVSIYEQDLEQLRRDNIAEAQPLITDLERLLNGGKLLFSLLNCIKV